MTTKEAEVAQLYARASAHMEEREEIERDLADLRRPDLTADEFKAIHLRSAHRIAALIPGARVNEQGLIDAPLPLPLPRDDR